MRSRMRFSRERVGKVCRNGVVPVHEPYLPLLPLPCTRIGIALEPYWQSYGPASIPSFGPLVGLGPDLRVQPGRSQSQLA
eukprot:14052218-Alexandrium_andersonii.AAC.1